MSAHFKDGDEVLRVFFVGSRLDLQRQFPRAGLDPEADGHFDQVNDLQSWTKYKANFLKEVGHETRILFEVINQPKKPNSLRRRLSTLCSLIDALPSTSFFIRCDRPLVLPDTLKHRIAFARGPYATPSNRKPKLLNMTVSPLLYPEFIKGHIVPGYRYSNAIVSAVQSAVQIRKGEGR